MNSCEISHSFKIVHYARTCGINILLPAFRYEKWGIEKDILSTIFNRGGNQGKNKTMKLQKNPRMWHHCGTAIYYALDILANMRCVVHKFVRKIRSKALRRSFYTRISPKFLFNRPYRSKLISRKTNTQKCILDTKLKTETLLLYDVIISRRIQK